jgi:hypothetical protein
MQYLAHQIASLLMNSDASAAIMNVEDVDGGCSPVPSLTSDSPVIEGQPFKQQIDKDLTTFVPSTHAKSSSLESTLLQLPPTGRSDLIDASNGSSLESTLLQPPPTGRSDLIDASAISNDPVLSNGPVLGDPSVRADPPIEMTQSNNLLDEAQLQTLMLQVLASLSRSRVPLNQPSGKWNGQCQTEAPPLNSPPTPPPTRHGSPLTIPSRHRLIVQRSRDSILSLGSVRDSIPPISAGTTMSSISAASSSALQSCPAFCPSRHTPSFTSTINKEGYLMKQGGSNLKTWKRRYFVLHGHSLYYFNDETDVKRQHVQTLGCIPLDSFYCIAQCDETGSPLEHVGMRRDYIFKIETVERTWYLSADSEHDFIEWMSALQNVLRANQQRVTKHRPVSFLDGSGEVQGWMEKHFKGTDEMIDLFHSVFVCPDQNDS